MYRRCLIALLVAVLSFPPAFIDQADAGYYRPDYYAAIAYSPSTGRRGYAHGQTSYSRACSLAIYYCNARDARVVVSSRNAWCCLALSNRTNNAWGTGYSTSRSSAINTALNGVRCRTGDGYVALIIYSGS